MARTVYFEPVNGYLARIYPREVEADSRVNYTGVVTIAIDGDKAVAKGLMGSITPKNEDDLRTLLKEAGVSVCTWERYDSHGNLRKSITTKL